MASPNTRGIRTPGINRDARCPYRSIAHMRGASLIEVTLSLALASVIFGVAIPSLLNIVARQSVLAESTRIRLALEEAYVAALSYDSPVIVAFANNGVDFSFGEAPPFLHLTHPQGVTSRLKSTELKQIALYPTHTATPATVLVQRGKVSCSVIVSLRGRIRRACA